MTRRTIPQLLGTLRVGAENIPQLGAQAVTVAAIDSLALEVNELAAVLRRLADAVGSLPAAGHPHMLGPLLNARDILRRGSTLEHPEPPLPDVQLANGGACS